MRHFKVVGLGDVLCDVLADSLCDDQGHSVTPDLIRSEDFSSR